MIYTIGYQKLTPERLREIVFGLNATLIDIRSNPRSRVKKGFSEFELSILLGTQYEWRGNLLGGRIEIDPWSIKQLEQFNSSRKNCVLMCQEHEPSDCHRHFAICSKHYPKAYHIFNDDLYTAEEIESSDSPSDCGSLKF